MSPRQARRHQQAGFTLLELLVAITILALLLVALSGGVHFAGRAWRAQEEQIGRQGDINAVQTVLRQMLASGRSFEGQPQSLKFVGRMPAALARGGLYDIELSTAGDRLLLAWRPHFKGATTALPQDAAILLEGVLGFNLAYYTATGGWQSVAKDKPAELIAIRARLSDGRPWPSLLILPAINASSNQKS